MKVGILVAIVVLGNLLLLVACDPVTTGSSFIENQTDFPLELRFSESKYGTDSVITIFPDSIIEFAPVFKMGMPRHFKCCPCQYPRLSIRAVDTAKAIVKDITNAGNWKLDNPNTGNTFKLVKCAFVVTENDVE